VPSPSCFVSFLMRQEGGACPSLHCETRRVGKDDGKGWNVIIPPESVVFWPIVISHLLSGEGLLKGKKATLDIIESGYVLG